MSPLSDKTLPPPNPIQSNQKSNRSSSDSVKKMAYVDHAFSISDDDDILMDSSSFTVHNRPPIREIALAVSLLVFGTLGIIFGVFMAVERVGGDTAHGIFFAILGSILFIPGFYYTRIAYYAYKGYKGFSFSNIPPV
ncbi:hypothetical protein RJ639_031907 [Escallonia herrerae]|uniref:Transmembrane protein 230 n=1 Tax=Escallonia herrerae TaxID=1293975 RepID=A0AA88X0V6_9ASTE|nr:hypothetical protein RJ639_031907 [Escallonia herrerae]